MESKSRWKTDTASLLEVLKWENARRSAISENVPLWNKKEAHLKDETFSQSVKRLTGEPPCPLCYGQQERRGTVLTCVRYPIHTLVLRTRCDHEPRKEYPEQCPECMKHMGKMMGGMCLHGYYTGECDECKRKLLEVNNG